MTDTPLNSDSAFAAEMQDVAPLKHTEKVELRKGSLDKATAAIRRLAAQTEQTTTAFTLGLVEIKKVEAQDAVGFKRPGIQDGVYRKLRLGRYEIEARLDLHQMRVEQAEREVKNFLRDCLEHDIRTVLIMPGKGDRSLDNPAVLKSHLVYWLEENETVQAFHTAQPQHGGTGAFYVLLRKSDRKKQQAREQFSRGRVAY